MFMVCDECDFEWHSKDGNICPICKKKLDLKDSYFDGRAFGTSLNSERINAWFAGIGIIALVGFIYAIIK